MLVRSCATELAPSPRICLWSSYVLTHCTCKKKGLSELLACAVMLTHPEVLAADLV